ncbi:MAG: hemolysin family protein [Proteobacteria bacterium]|nr:hemolysin family protein [Pseudomonadota bacterium]MBU1710572.1 hemolysin family protein [Pseudomonadota bacterium]
MDNPPAHESGESSLFKRLLQYIGINRSPDTAEDLEQEIHELLEEGEESGLISSREGQMISSILEFRDTLVHEIMTPRSEIISAEASEPISKIISIINESGFSRIPIYTDNKPDEIIGVLHAKDLLTGIFAEPQPSAGEMAKSASFVHEQQKIVDILRDFQNNKNHMAIVTDEFGGVRGLVTLEDVLEEIVGEINDEYDTLEQPWKIIKDNTILTDAKVNVEDIESFFKNKLPEGPYESIGGLVIHKLGRVPLKGTEIEIDGLHIQVIAATKRRILTLKIQKIS